MGSVALLSSVRIGLLDALGATLARGLGVDVRVLTALSDAKWRTDRSRGRGAALRARARSLLFPVSVRLGRSRERRVVVATTNPFWLPTLLALRRVRPLVVLVYDVYPDALAVRWRLPGWLKAAATGLVGFGLRRADAVVVLGERVRSALVARHDLTCPVAVIPTGADPTDFDDADPDRLPVDVPDTATLISYVGNTGSVHDGTTPGAALAAVLAARPRTRAIVATRGDRADEFLAPLRGEPRASLHPELDDAAFHATLSRTDIALVTLDAGAGIASVPSKVYPALATGCAVLAVAPTGSDLAGLVASTGAGIVVAPGDVAAATDALTLLVDDVDLRRRHAESARAAAARFTPEALARSWAAVLRPLLES